MKNKRLSKKTIVGYGIAGLGNNVAASLFLYLLYILPHYNSRSQPGCSWNDFFDRRFVGWD